MKENLHVYAPTSVLFLCGGQIAPVATPTPPLMSLRDAFVRMMHRAPFSNYNVLLAEELTSLFSTRGRYKDILTFESDIAQISDLILLFSESFGSAAELGAFTMVDEIASRLMVVMDDQHYESDSFIRLGPVRLLEEKYSEQAICVLLREEININHITKVSNLDLDVFYARMASAISERKRVKSDKSTFDKRREGHIIKFVVGLLQHYGALTIHEIDTYLLSLSFNEHRGRLDDLLLCAEFAKWIFKQKRGIETYYAPIVKKQALSYKLLPEYKTPEFDRLRWRALIQEYWKANQTERFNVIRESVRRTAA